MRGQRVTMWVVLLAVAASGCGPKPTRDLQVCGNDLGMTSASVMVAKGKVPVRDAQVTVNGDALSLSPTAGLYWGDLSRAVPTGGAFHLEVRQGGSSVIGDGTMPAAPVLTGPLDSTTYATGQDIVVTWTTDSLPDRFQVNASWSCGPACGGGGTGVRVPAAGTDTTAVIPWSELILPPGGLPPGTDVTVSVFAYNDGTLVGDYSSDTRVEAEHALGGAPGIITYSRGMNIRAESHPVVVHYVQ